MSGRAALDALRAGGKPALARALAALEAAAGLPETTALLDAALADPRGASVGLTGPPGVGKSTLLDAMVRHWRGQGETVGVIAVDPSSRRTGGALLGDRTRLSTDPGDGGVFVRSMAARDRLGGIAAPTFPAMVLMRAVFDWVVVETVGVGQSETEIAGLADRVVFCAQPASGDALQFMKAGVMEIPDLVLVTKADMGAPADRAAADLRSALGLAARRSGEDAPRVLTVSASTGGGLDGVLDALGARRRAAGAGVTARHRAQVARWQESQLLHQYGRAGVAALARAGLAAGAGAAPFAETAALAARLDAALGEAFGSHSATG